ncbi:MAG: response regulator transcription factor [Parvibaculaceae bacterium]
MSGPPTSVAVVDDDTAVRTALKKLLCAASFDAQAYGSAEEFLASLSLRVPQCLILDLQMPGTTGFELHCQLIASNIKIPTIFITAHDREGVREQCESSDGAAFLLKPLRRATLIAAINAATGTRA